MVTLKEAMKDEKKEEIINARLKNVFRDGQSGEKNELERPAIRWWIRNHILGWEKPVTYHCSDCTKMRKKGIMDICLEESDLPERIYKEVRRDYLCCEKIEFRTNEIRPSPHDVVSGARDGDHFTVILIGDVNKPMMNAIHFARLLGDETVVVHMGINSSDKGRIEERWRDLGVDVPLVVKPRFDP